MMIQVAAFALVALLLLAELGGCDHKLRTLLGTRVLEQFNGQASLTPEQQDLLLRASENALMLVSIAPDRARSHQILGMTQILLGTHTGAPIEFMRAAASLRRALSIDPELPGTAKALQIAQTRSPH